MPASDRTPTSPTARTSKGVKYRADGSVHQCLFCRIARGELQPGSGKRGSAGEASRARGLLYSDDYVVAFLPRDPCARFHILVTPRHHVRNVNTLRGSHVPLLVHMHAVGRALLEREEHGLDTRALVTPPLPLGRAGGEPSDAGKAVMPTTSLGADVAADEPRNGRMYRFHVPPFNSIDHLHLHCFGKPFTSAFQRLAYNGSAWWTDSANNIVRRLDRQRVTQLRRGNTAAAEEVGGGGDGDRTGDGSGAGGAAASGGSAPAVSKL